MPKPMFFFSYARDDLQGQQVLFDDLVKALKPKTGKTAAELGFLDSRTIDAGDDWEHDLPEALQCCRVFVFLLSATYWKRSSCGKEWQFFKTRLAGHKNPKAPLMVPILWQPHNPLPEWASGIQYANDKYGPTYGKKGLKLLMALGATQFKDEYNFFIDEFTDRLLEVEKDADLQPAPALPVFKDLPNAFEVKKHAPDPGAIRKAASEVLFYYAVGSKKDLDGIRPKLDPYGVVPSHWQPFEPPPAKKIFNAAQEAATAVDLETTKLDEPLDVDNIEKLLRSYEKDEKIVAIIVDPWSLRLPQYRKTLSRYNELRFRNCVVFVPWNPEDEETQAEAEKLTAELNEVFDRDGERNYRRAMTLDKLAEEFKAGLDACRLNILKFSEKSAQVSGAGPRSVPTINNTTGNP